MFKHQIGVFGRAMPTWLLIATLVLAGAGAAVGTVLAGKITAEVPVTVEQAQVVRSKPTQVTGYEADQFFASMKDDGTAFTAAAELNTGDEWRFDVPISNNSAAPLVGEVTLTFPTGLTLDVDSGHTNTQNVCRTGLFTWKFDQLVGDGVLRIKVGVADEIAPGFYKIEGTIEQVPY